LPSVDRGASSGIGNPLVARTALEVGVVEENEAMASAATVVACCFLKAAESTPPTELSRFPVNWAFNSGASSGGADEDEDEDEEEAAAAGCGGAGVVIEASASASREKRAPFFFTKRLFAVFTRPLLFAGTADT
jgi:hypothetical protein